MDVKRFRELLATGKTTRQARCLSTSYIIQNISVFVKQHNKEYGSPQSYFCGAFKAYNDFMIKTRPYYFEANNRSYTNLLKDQAFCEKLIKLLKKWGAFRRGGVSQQFKSTLGGV